MDQHWNIYIYNHNDIKCLVTCYTVQWHSLNEPMDQHWNIYNHNADIIVIMIII